MSSVAFVALGANLGDRAANLTRAIDLIHHLPTTRVTKTSAFLDNPAIGGPSNSPQFLNAAIEVQTSLPPRELLDCLLDIERQLGRQRREKWGPRSIDLDLLLFDERIIDEPSLILPHPRLHERRFVLEPLGEIAPSVVHPRLHRTIGELLAAIK